MDKQYESTTTFAMGVGNYQIINKEVNIPNSEFQLQRLDRNQKHIAQLFGKLCSYICEPRTQEQFMKVNDLKTTAWELREANVAISATFRNDRNATVRGMRMLERHMQKSVVFSKTVQGYFEEVKLHRTAYI